MAEVAVKEDTTSVLSQIADKKLKRQESQKPAEEKKPEAKVEESAKTVGEKLADKPQAKADEKKPEVKEATKAEDKPEAKAEEKKPEVKAEAKPAETKTEKQWWDDENDATTVTDKASSSKKPEIDYEAKFKEYEKILSDTEIQALIAAKKSGKDLMTFVKEIKGTDVKAMSPEDLFKIKLQRLGSDESEIAEAMEDFSALKAWEKKEKTQDMKSILETEQSENLKKVTQGSFEMAAKQQKVVEKAQADLEKYVADLNGKELYGVKITPEIASGIKETVSNGIPDLTNEDGSWNIPAYAEIALWHKFKKTMMKANAAKITAQVKEEMLKEFSRPSQNNNTSDKRLPSENAADLKDSRKEYLAEKRAAYGK